MLTTGNNGTNWFQVKSMYLLEQNDSLVPALLITTKLTAHAKVLL